MVDTPNEIEPTGYVVAVKTDKPYTYLLRDIAEMTSSEFRDWLLSIYPHRFTDEEQFDSRLTRLKSLEFAMAFWTQELFRVRK